jgi:plasmid stability protein
MPVNFSIKNIPDDVAEQLRQRANRHRRSLQGELLSILEHTVANERSLSPLEFLSEIRAKGLKTPSESARFIRADRDAH